MSSIPPRLRQSYCEQFVPAFTAAKERWPAPYRVTGYSQSATTLAARLRDALLSMRRYSWGPKDLPDFIVCHRDDAVYLQSNDADLAKVMQVPTTTPKAVEVTLTLTTVELEAFCLLLSKRYIFGPVYINADFDTAYIARLESQFDVAITFEPSLSRYQLL